MLPALISGLARGAAIGAATKGDQDEQIIESKQTIAKAIPRTGISSPTFKTPTPISTSSIPTTAVNDNPVVSAESGGIFKSVLTVLSRIESTMKQQVALTIADMKANREIMLEKGDDTQAFGNASGETSVQKANEQMGLLATGLAAAVGGVMLFSKEIKAGIDHIQSLWDKIEDLIPGGSEHRTPEQIAAAQQRAQGLDEILTGGRKVGDPILVDEAGFQGSGKSKLKGNVTKDGKRIASKLIAQGLTKQQAAAVVGHWQHESGLDSGRTNPNDRGMPSSGLAQWRAERRANLMRFAKKRGTSWKDEDTQIAFFMHELNTNEASAGTRLRKAQSIEQASMAMSSFERYAGWNGRGRSASDVRHGRTQNRIRTEAARAHYQNLGQVNGYAPASKPGVSARSTTPVAGTPSWTDVLNIDWWTGKKTTAVAEPKAVSSIQTSQKFKPAAPTPGSVIPKAGPAKVAMMNGPTVVAPTYVGQQSASRQGTGSVPNPGKISPVLSYQQYFNA